MVQRPGQLLRQRALAQHRAHGRIRAAGEMEPAWGRIQPDVPAQHHGPREGGDQISNALGVMNLSNPPLQEPVSNTNPRWALWFSRIQALFLNIKTATASLDFGSINAAASADLTITVPGVVANDSVELGLPAAPTAGKIGRAHV